MDDFYNELKEVLDSLPKKAAKDIMITENSPASLAVKVAVHVSLCVTSIPVIRLITLPYFYRR